jgi:hypothetical protein
LHFTGKSAKIYGMKRLFLPICTFFLLVGAAAAVELEVIGGVNGLTFNPDKTEVYEEPDAEREFTPNLFGLLNLSVRYDFSETLNFNVNIERDNILQNSINAVFGAKTDYFNFKFGAFLGLTDNFDIPDAGISGNMELIIPGIFLLSLSGSSTLGVQFDYTNNYRETAGIKIGFWLGNAAVSLCADMKSLSRQEDESLIVSDTLLRFLLNYEFFVKNSNLSGVLYAGYQTYTRSYRIETVEYDDELTSLLAGFEFNWQVTRTLCLKTGVEIPFNITAAQPMIVNPDYLSLLKVYAGFIYSINK